MPKREKKTLPVPPQRFNWKTVAKFGKYEEAVSDMEKRPASEGKRFKVKRRKGVFEVRMGTPV